MIWGYISDDRFLPEPVHGYVYFIRDGLGHIKIGIAKNVKRRMRALQTNNPMRLEYYFGLKVESIDDARIIERELHEVFKDDRLCGEWFNEKPVLAFLSNKTLDLGGYIFNGVGG